MTCRITLGDYGTVVHHPEFQSETFLCHGRVEPGPDHVRGPGRFLFDHLNCQHSSREQGLRTLGRPDALVFVFTPMAGE